MTRMRWISVVAGLALALVLGASTVTLPSDVGEWLRVEEWTLSARAEADARAEAVVPAKEEAKTYHWERFDTEIVVNADGTIDVTERQTIRFENGEFSNGYRHIPKKGLSSVDNWSVTGDDGREFGRAESGESPNSFVVEESEGEYSVWWYFPPMRDASATFTVSYTVHGAVRHFDQADLVSWTAMFDRRDQPIRAGSVRVVTPAEIQEYAAYINGRPAGPRVSAAVDGEEFAAVFELKDILQGSERLEVRIEFAPGAAGRPDEEEKAASGTEPIQFSLLPLSEGKTLSAQDLFAQVSPAVAYIETPNGTGSAVLVEHGYLVSAAHVVWPHEQVRAVFPGGAEFPNLPVVAWDLMMDVALLGPVDLEQLGVGPLALSDGSGLPIGSEVYLIGYPAEFERFPQPALGRGLVSRTREWEETGLSMFQVDGDASGGQSGGALLSEQGDLIGITNYRFTDSNSPMVTSSEDVVPCLIAMQEGAALTLADRRPMAQTSTYTYEGVLEDDLSYDYFLLLADSGERVDLEAEGIGDPMVTVATFLGEILDSSMPVAAKTSGIATTLWGNGPYLVEVTQFSINRNPYTLTSSHPLYKIADPDDGIRMEFGDTYVGSMDNPGDTDVFTIHLRAGNKLVVEVESLTIDPLVAVSYYSPSRQDFVIDDDSGPAGIFGLNARMVFVAAEEGEYTILVGDSENLAVGGYIMRVSEGKWSDRVTETGYGLDHYLSSYGTFARYGSGYFPFTMLYPSHFTDSMICGPEASACFEAFDGMLSIFELSFSELAPSERTPDAMLDSVMDGMGLAGGSIAPLSRNTLTTFQGLEGKMQALTMFNDTVYMAVFTLFDEGSGVFSGIFGTDLTADYTVEDAQELAEFLFSTVHVYTDEGVTSDPIFHLEAAMNQAAKGYYRLALADLKFALMLDEGLVQAYAVRARVHSLMGEYDLALADLDEALELAPDSVHLLVGQAVQYWLKGEYDQALERAAQIIELRPNFYEAYQLRSLVHAAAGDYEAALAELTPLETMIDGGMPPYVLDTRAYVQLKSGALDEALADYEDVLGEDFQTATSLLGAGVTYARLDRMEKALPLLRYGMEKYEEAEYEIVDPQLAELLMWAQEILEAEGG